MAHDPSMDIASYGTLLRRNKLSRPDNHDPTEPMLPEDEDMTDWRQKQEQDELEQWLDKLEQSPQTAFGGAS